MTNRWTVAAVALGIAFAAAAGAKLVVSPASASPNAKESAPGAVTVGVSVAEPVEGYLRERVYTGTLVARRRSVLAFERAGKVVEMLVDEGDAIAKDQPLARLDTRRLTAKRAESEADLAQAMATLRELQAGPRTETIAAAEAEVASLTAQRDVAEKNLRRRERLVETQAVSREEYEEMLYLHRAAAARTDVAQRALDELKAGTRQEQIDAQLARVTSIEARLADIFHELDDSVLLAPYDGRVAKRRVDEGTVIAPGDAVLELVEAGPIEAWVGLPPGSADRLKVGEPVAVSVGEVEQVGVVQSVRPELDASTRTRNVVLRIDAPAGWVAGQVARVTVEEPVEAQGMWVPTASLSPGARGLWSVLVVEPSGKAAARPVEVLESDDDRSFVRGALASGEKVIVEGSHRIVAGQAVTSTETPPSPAPRPSPLPR